jgi:hypothetical protein
MLAKYLFETEPDWGIPILDSQRQPDLIPSPILPWGAVSRTKRTAPAYHFYVDDVKFEPLWRSPDKLLRVQPLVVVEPNFSITADDSKAVCFWQLYRKRTLARIWQAAGIDVLVDLNVPDKYLDYALLGVPSGWSGYATRGHHVEPKLVLLRQYAIAKSHSGLDKPYFLVYAGGKSVQALCRRHGWVYLDTYRGGA